MNYRRELNRAESEKSADGDKSIRRFPTSDRKIAAPADFMQTALPLQPAETRVLLALAGLQGRAAVPVADGNIALIPKWVVRQVVCVR